MRDEVEDRKAKVGKKVARQKGEGRSKEVVKKKRVWRDEERRKGKVLRWEGRRV